MAGAAGGFEKAKDVNYGSTTSALTCAGDVERAVRDEGGSRGESAMLRVSAWAVVLVVTGTMSARAQIISNPVVTTFTPYAGSVSYAVSPPVAPSPCCAPPSVTYCDPCAQPTTTYYAPSTMMWTARRPVSWAVPVTASYAPAARMYVPTTSYYAPTVMYRIPASSPVTVYSMPDSTSLPMSSYAAPTAPGVSYGVPAAAAAPVTSVPGAASGGCNCRGG